MEGMYPKLELEYGWMKPFLIILIILIHYVLLQLCQVLLKKEIAQELLDMVLLPQIIAMKLLFGVELILMPVLKVHHGELLKVQHLIL